MSDALAPWLRDASLVVFVGDGGVGKTTCAAAAALAAARAGRSVCALTIDPAPRLAEALGMTTLDDSPRAVDLGRFGVEDGHAALSAMRLDTQATFDRLVRRYAPSEDAARKILSSPLYQVVAGRLGGSDVYMAFQRVYELVDQEHYDLIVIDTPPAVHADELFSAPARLATLLDSGATKMIANPAVLITQAGSRMAAAAARLIVAALSRVTGVDLLQRISEFTGAMEGVLDALSGRATRIDEMLHGPSARYVHVGTAADGSAADARRVADALAAHGIAPSAWIVNRLMPEAHRADHAVAASAGDRFRGAPPGTREAVELIEADLAAVRARERAEIERLVAALGGDTGMLKIDARVLDPTAGLELGKLADAFGAR